MEVKLQTYVDESTVQEQKSNMEIVKLVGVGLNATKMVELSDGTIGFLKNSANTSNAMLDDLEYYMYIIGKHIFDMDFANVSKAYDENGFVGTISENVAKENERLMMYSEIITTLASEQTEEIQQLAFKYKNLRENNIKTFVKPNGDSVTYPVLESEEDMVAAIDMFIETLDQLNISEENKKDIKEKYFQMIVFDLITGQKDRNSNNYGLLYNQVTKQMRFSPLFDNSTIHLPGIPENLCQINGFFMDKKQMMSVLLTHYGEYTSNIINSIVDNKDEIVKRSGDVAERVLTSKEKDWVMPIITDNINMLSEVATKSKRGSI